MSPKVIEIRSPNMATIRKFEDIVAWQKATLLHADLGRIIDRGKFKNDFGLVRQIEGSAVHGQYCRRF